jgi:hypothetical protein
MISKKRRGPLPTGKGVPIVTRLQPEQLAQLDKWIAEQDDKPSRPEAVRRLMQFGLETGSGKPPAGSARALKAKPSPAPTARPGAKKSAKATTKAGPLKKAPPRRS